MINSVVLPQWLLRRTFTPVNIPGRVRQLLWLVVFVFTGLAIAWLPLREAFLLIGGITFLTILLITPILALFLLIPIIPFSPLFSISAGGVRVGLMEIVLITTILAWLLKLAAAPPDSQSPSQSISYRPKMVLLLPFLLLLGGVSLSWLNALSIRASLIETLKWVEMLALYLFIVVSLPRRRIKLAVTVILLAALAQAVLGLYQFIFKVGPEGFLLFDGRFLRAYGTFAQPNPYAGYLGLTIPLAVSLLMWCLLDWQPSDAMSPLDRLYSWSGSRAILLSLLGVTLSILLAALFATQSRSAWLGFGVATAAILAIYNRKTALILAMIILAGAMVALPGTFDLGPGPVNASYQAVVQRVVAAGSIFTINDISGIEVTDANFATLDRLAHWQAAREMWRDNLWLGVGFGNYPVVYPAYAIGRWLDPLGHAHNYLLNIGAEAGLTGIAVYLIFWIWTFAVLWQTVRHSFGFYKAVAVGGFGIMVHLHIHNFFDNLYVQGMYLHLAIILAVASIIYKPKST